MVGRPWERLDSVEIATLSAEYGGEKLKREELRELGQMFESRRREELRWVLDDDVELREEWLESEKRPWDPSKRRRSEAEVIRFLVDRFVFGTFQIFQILFTLIKFLSLFIVSFQSIFMVLLNITDKNLFLVVYRER